MRINDYVLPLPHRLQGPNGHVREHYIRAHGPAPKPVVDRRSIPGSDIWIRQSLEYLSARVERLCLKVLAHNPDADVEFIKAAATFAAEAHCSIGQTRKSGDPYIVHILGVAEILAEIKADALTVGAGLAHDVAEDVPDYRDSFASRVYSSLSSFNLKMVDGFLVILQAVNKLEAPSKAEVNYHLIASCVREIRAILVKLADRLDNQRDFRAMKLKTREKKSRETRRVHAPLAEIIGLWPIRCELYDTTMRDLEPGVYHALFKGRRDLIRKYVGRLRKIRDSLKKVLRENEMPGVVVYRPRCLWDIWQASMRRRDAQPQVRLEDISSFAVVVGDEVEPFLVFGRLVDHPAFTYRQKTLVRRKHGVGHYRALSCRLGARDHGGMPVRLKLSTERDYDLAQRGLVAALELDPKAATRDQAFMRELLILAGEQGVTRQQIARLVPSAVYAVKIFDKDRNEHQIPRGPSLEPLSLFEAAAYIWPAMLPRILGVKVNGEEAALGQPVEWGQRIVYRLSGNTVFDPARLGLLKTPKAKKVLRAAYRQVDYKAVVSAGRDILASLLPSYLIEFEYLTRSKVFQAFMASYWQNNINGTQRRLALEAKYGDTTRVFVDGAHMKKYGSKNKIGLANAKKGKVVWSDFVWLIGQGEVDAADFLQSYFNFRARYVLNARRKWLRIPVVRVEIKSNDFEGLGEVLSSLWRGLHLSFSAGSFTSIDGQNAQATFEFAGATAVMRRQIETMVTLLGENKHGLFLLEVSESQSFFHQLTRTRKGKA